MCIDLIDSNIQIAIISTTGTLAKTRIYNSTKVQNILAEIVDNDNYWENNKLTISNDAVKNAITNMIKIMRSELKIEDK